MERFLEPRSVAIIGASRRTGRGSFSLIDKLLEFGFRGSIYPVNPETDSVGGLKSYRTVDALPSGIDLAVVMVPREKVPGVVAKGVERGIMAFVIITEGFAEADQEGRGLQSEIVNIAKDSGARIVGPNSLGVANGFHRFASSFVTPRLRRNPIAFVCQSGGLMDGFAGFAPGKSIDLGNMCDVDFVDALDEFEDDPEIRVLALHIEGLRDGREFLRAARRVCQKKPVVVLKAGKSQRAAEAAASHTGSLAGRDEIHRAAFRQAGLIQVDNVDELGDITEAFLHLPPLGGNKIAILTPSGAAATMSLDAMDVHRLELARLSERTIHDLRGFFPPWSPPANPIDMMAAGIKHGYKMVFQRSLRMLLEDENTDGVLCIAGFPTLKTIRATIDGANKPVVTWVIGEWGENLQSAVKETGYRAVYSTPQRAARVLSALGQYAALGRAGD